MQFITTLCTYQSNPGRYLKSLSINERYSEIFKQAGLLKLLLLKCPNIEILDICPKPAGDVFEEIRNAFEEGACKNLRQIPMIRKSCTEADKKKYVDALCCLCNNIEELRLDEDFKINSNRPLLECLFEFPNLRYLSIHIKRMDTVYLIGESIKNCSDLTQLALSWYPNLTVNPDSVMDVHSTTRCPTITNLVLFGIPFLTENLIEYIIHAFPNITCLDINTFQRWNYISDNLWAQFLVYLEKRACKISGMSNMDIPRLASILNIVKPSDNLSIIYQHYPPYIQLHNEASKYIFTAYFDMIQDSKDQLPHFRLIRNVGCYLKVLHFGPSKMDTGGEFLNRYGLHLDYILQQCHSLDRLHLSNLILTNCGSVPRTHKSIQKLSISNCRVSQRFFQELSVRFQSLHNLYLKNLCIEDSSGNYQKWYQEYMIEMPNTTFDTLTWVMDDPRFRKFDTLNVDIVTATESYYYVVSKDGSIAESSYISFVSVWDSLNTFSMHIQCQDMQKLDLTVFGTSCIIDLSKL
jgi:hypothetical protein